MSRILKEGRGVFEVAGGETIPCPRCGENGLDPAIAQNALSRYVNIYICSQCGVEEALLDVIGAVKPFHEWAVFRNLKTGGGDRLVGIYHLYRIAESGERLMIAPSFDSEGLIAAGKQLEKENPGMKFAVADENGVFLWNGNGALQEDAEG